MGANFKPSKNTVKHVETFDHWCQKVLPLVYDDSLSYYELLCKVSEILNKVNEKYYQCTGCYAIWEHYKGSASSGFSCNHFTKVYAKDEQGNVLCDDFKRANGSVGVAPQDYVYSQFTNLNQTGWVF